jgi:DNA-binding protein Fis
LLEKVFSRANEKAAQFPTQIGGIEGLMDELLSQARGGADLDVHARVFEEMERQLFSRAIRLAQGNQAKAARWLKMSRQTVREKLQNFGLKTSGDESDS